MDRHDDLFVRDNLEDQGQHPSKGSWSSSPDVICHPQVVDPYEFFSKNYDKDLNHDYQYGHYNFVYVRAKNLGAVQSENAWIEAHWCRASLALFPEQWEGQRMKTKEGKEKVELAIAKPGAIVVGATPFAWAPPNKEEEYHICKCVRVVTTKYPNKPPGKLETWNALVAWVRDSPNVGWRNIKIVVAYPPTAFSRLHWFENRTATDEKFVFTAKCIDLVKGAKVELKCSPLNINKSLVISGSPKPEILVDAGIAPSGFAGAVELKAYLPQGVTQWKGKIELSAELVAFAKKDYGGDMRRFAHEWHQEELALLDISPDVALPVRVGEVATVFKS